VRCSIIDATPIGERGDTVLKDWRGNKIKNCPRRCLLWLPKCDECKGLRMDTHSLERTSPKGGKFIGRCVKCGKTDLPSSACFEECPNPSGITSDQSVINAIEGEPCKL
jgi:hypothetical protein